MQNVIYIILDAELFELDGKLSAVVVEDEI
jgi:hypothetical protein